MKVCVKERCNRPAILRIRNKAGHWGHLNIVTAEISNNSKPSPWRYYCERHGASYRDRVTDDYVEIEKLSPKGKGD